MSNSFGENNFFGRRLKEARTAQNLSQAALGTEVGTGSTTINNWEKGVSFPHVEMLMKLASFFNLTPNDLLLEHSNGLNIAAEPRERYGVVHRDKQVGSREPPDKNTIHLPQLDELIKEVRLLREEVSNLKHKS